MVDSETRSRRPDAGEYPEYYAPYVQRVGGGDVLGILRGQVSETASLLEGLPEERHSFRYAEGKWTLRQVVGHMLDVEWVFTYRALRFARGDATPLPTMPHEDFVENGNADERSLSDLLAELRSLRAANTGLFGSFDEGILDRRGNASGGDFNVRSILYIIAGHELHHRQVLRERYL
ncbi:MAG: DinB family protein [Planctomycetota bacterium]